MTDDSSLNRVFPLFSIILKGVDDSFLIQARSTIIYNLLSII